MKKMRIKQKRRKQTYRKPNKKEISKDETRKFQTGKSFRREKQEDSPRYTESKLLKNCYKCIIQSDRERKETQDTNFTVMHFRKNIGIYNSKQK